MESGDASSRRGARGGRNRARGRGCGRGRGFAHALAKEQRAQLLEMRSRKEVGQFILPDAPPKKKTRRTSPERIPCPLMPGTPEVPPPRTPRPWEIERRDTSGPSRVEPDSADDTVSSVTAPPNTRQSLVFTPSTGVITSPEEGIPYEPLIVPARIEVIDLSSCTSISTLSPSTSAQCSMPSTSADESEPGIFTEDLEVNILQWEPSADLNAGSDVDDDDETAGSHRRHVGEYDSDELTSDLRETLESLDKQDDCALRELANQDMLHFDWSHDPEAFKGEREVFTGTAGPTFSADDMSPFQVFSKIWDEDIINLIVRETNKYGESLRREVSEHSRMQKWFPVTPSELWRFFGIMMLQSIAPIPVEQDYWTPCLPYLKIGNFADIMPFHRFQLIKRCLHFVDNDLCANSVPTKLTKIKPIVDHLCHKFSSLYLPEREIVIDESLLLWSGRLSFAQSIKTKAAQVGIKTYELCESKSGYLWQMIVYTGKDKGHNVGEVQADRHDAEPGGATSKIVYSLVRPLLNKGHTLVMDNFYNSPLLARTLKAKHTDVLGTLRLNREFVPESLRHKNKANMRPGEVAFSHTRDMTITVWRDANVVALISTYHNVEVGGKEKYGVYKYKPNVVLDYNLTMGGVDKKDQFLQAFPIERIRNTIWYKKFFRRLFNVSIHNSFVIYSKARTVNVAKRQFRIKLVDEILQRFRPLKLKPIAALTTGHYPAKNNKKRARCKWCYKKKRNRSTKYKCDFCNVDLCIIDCFKEYHESLGQNSSK